MAFVWSEDVSVGASIDAADVNEVKTNLDTIYDDLSITRNGCGSGAGWSEFPVSAGDAITSAQFQEMRDVADYAYDNKCPGYDSDYNSGVDSDDDSGVDGDYNSVVNSNEHTGYDNGDDGTAQSPNNDTVQGYNYTIDTCGPLM